jgi:hypothetical protein
MQNSSKGEREMSRKFIRQHSCEKAAPERRPLLAVAIAFAFVFLAGTIAGQAQDDPPAPPLPVDPTPLAQLLTTAERGALAGEQNPKKIVEIYLKFSDAHLDAALVDIKGGSASKAERELDIYNKIMAEVTKITFSMQDGKRSLSKKMEQSLYKQLRTLESIERLFPAERVAFAEDAIKKAKQIRVQALNQAFAGGEVLKDPNPEKPPTSVLLEKETAPASDAPTRPALSLDSGAIHRVRFDQSNLLIAPNRLRRVDFVASAQIPGDYLTEEEDEHVREAQKPDDRIKVFIKIADRRLIALTAAAPTGGDAKAQKKLEEEMREWGALPKLTRTELLRHYARSIEEGMAKLEDAYERNPKSSAIPKALVALRDATDRHLQTLRSLESQVKEDKESGALKDAIDQAQAANKGARDGLAGK